MCLCRKDKPLTQLLGIEKLQSITSLAKSGKVISNITYSLLFKFNREYCLTVISL